MEISFLMPDLGYSGGSQVIYEIANRLKKRGHNVYIVTPGTTIMWEEDLNKLLRQNFHKTQINSLSGIEINSLINDFSNEMLSLTLNSKTEIPLYMFIIGKITDSLIKKIPPSDFVIATHNLTAFAAYYNNAKAIPIYFVQGFEENLYSNPIIKKTARLTYHLPMIIIVNSIDLNERIKNTYKRQTIVIQPAIDTNIFKPYIDPKKKYTSNKDLLDICYYFSLNPLKGFPYFFDCVKKLKSITNISFRIHIFGSYPGTIDQDIDIRYYGKIFDEELAKLYSSCDVFINTSTEDSFPLTTIEAMGCGTLCITTDAGNSDYVIDGYNAIVVKQKSCCDIVKELINFVSDRKRYLSIVENGIKTAQSFSWDKTVKRFEYILLKTKSIGGINENQNIDSR